MSNENVENEKIGLSWHHGDSLSTDFTSLANDLNSITDISSYLAQWTKLDVPAPAPKLDSIIIVVFRSEQAFVVLGTEFRCGDTKVDILAS